MVKKELALERVIDKTHLYRYTLLEKATLHKKEDRTQFDVAIVGASLAGSAAAISLAREGLSVALFDKSEFPRHKPCGEGLSHLAFPLIEDLGISLKALQNDESRFFGFKFILPRSLKTGSHVFETRSAHLRGCGVSRAEIDSVINARVLDFENISLHLNEAVHDVKREAGRWLVSTSKSAVKSRYLLLAHGSLGTKLLSDELLMRRGESKRMGYSMMARLVSGYIQSVVSVMPLMAGEIYITPLSDARINISLVGSRDFIQRYRDQSLLHRYLSEHLKIEFEILWRGAGAANFEVATKSSHPELFLIGDACETFDPACGLGMTHALVSARLASQLIGKIEQGQIAPHQAVEMFDRIHGKVSRRIRLFSRMVRQLFLLYRLVPSFFPIIGERLSGMILATLERWSDPTIPLAELLSRPEVQVKERPVRV